MKILFIYKCKIILLLITTFVLFTSFEINNPIKLFRKLNLSNIDSIEFYYYFGNSTDIRYFLNKTSQTNKNNKYYWSPDYRMTLLKSDTMIISLNNALMAMKSDNLKRIRKKNYYDIVKKTIDYKIDTTLRHFTIRILIDDESYLISPLSQTIYVGTTNRKKAPAILNTDRDFVHLFDYSGSFFYKDTLINKLFFNLTNHIIARHNSNIADSLKFPNIKGLYFSSPAVR
jgi:hypothetical protein